MALHARLFTNNILRVSKLKKWSQASQAIDRCSEKSAVEYCPQSTNDTAEQVDSRPIDSKCEGGQFPSWTLQPFSMDALEPTFPERTQSLASQPPLDFMTLKTAEKIFVQEYLPHIVKSVSYTADDIMLCPVDQECHTERGIVYENHAVTMLTERDQQRQFGATRDSFRKNVLCTSDEKDTSMLHRNRFRRHSVCESNPTQQRQTHCIDSEGKESGTDTVFCCPSSDPEVLCSAEGRAGASSGGGQESSGKGPTLDKLREVERVFIEMLPKFFKSRLDYSLCHPQIIFENNFWGKNEVTIGINSYASQLMKLRVLCHLKYANVHMEVVSSACLLEEGVVRLQWRMVGLSQLKALRFWRYTPWNYSKTFRQDAEWMEGISILHINKDGLVTKHRLDIVTPSEEGMSNKAPSLAAKVALLLGLSAPRPGLSDWSSLLFRQ